MRLYIYCVSIYIYVYHTYLCVCVCLCVCVLFLLCVCTSPCPCLEDYIGMPQHWHRAATSRPRFWPSGDRSHGDRWWKVGPRQTPRCSAWGWPGFALGNTESGNRRGNNKQKNWKVGESLPLNRDVSVTEGEYGAIRLREHSWTTIVKSKSNQSSRNLGTNIFQLPTSSNTSRGQLNPWSQGAGRAKSTAACTIQAMKGVWDT